VVANDARIRLEYEQPYDWICFVPRREKSTGALTKYFGKVRNEDEYKIRGIEIRQRSTPPFIETVQREFMDVLDRHREPEPVCDRLQVHLSPLRAGDVNPQELVFRKRVSKRLEEYTQGTHTVSALMRYRDHGIEKHPGQDVKYVVVDDNVRQPERVRLHFEEVDTYAGEFYEDVLVRAAESIVSPMGWDRRRIRKYLRGNRDVDLAAFE
jgi:DNA polymerase I